jgi:DNA-binding MarR family transcriptional regulator
MRQIDRAGARSEALIGGVARRYGLSHAALNALAVIEAAGGPLPTGEVTAQMHISTATTTSVLDTLERNGYLMRTSDPGDRRRVLVDITPRAQAVLDQALPAVQQVVTATLGVLDEQTLRTLLRVLTSASDAMDTAPGDLPPPAPRQAPAHLRRA